MEERYLTVSALTKYIKYKFDHDRHLDEVLLEGEISNFKHNSRGHFYFTLKDEASQISATMFASSASKVKFEPYDGLKVYVKGNVSVYEPSGTYQINVKEMSGIGLGDLTIQYEKLKKELAEAGFFNEDHKRPIPKFPKTIGVVTSPTGAAIKDIINTVGRRYPMATLILYPAIVQGDDAKNDVVKQIKRANSDNLVDVLIVGRGGGSIEDLWAFNERIVAEAIYNSRIPIISAVGHEIDFTIADFVADKRAATPTAAAELATPNRDTLKQNVNYYVDALTKKINFILREDKMRLSNIDRMLESNNPTNTLKHKKEMLGAYVDRLQVLMDGIINLKNHQFELCRSRLEGANPLAIMDKGYSIVECDGNIVTDIDTVKVDSEITTKLKNGVIKSKVIEVKKNGK